MTIQQIIALVNAGFTEQQIVTINNSMGINPAGMNVPTQHIQTPPTQPAQHIQTPPTQPMAQPAQQIQTPPIQPMAQREYNVGYSAMGGNSMEAQRQQESMQTVPQTGTDFTIGFQGHAGHVQINPQVLAQYQAQNRNNSGMSINPVPTMESITDQIINGAVEASTSGMNVK